MKRAAVVAGALALAAIGCRKPPSPLQTLEEIFLSRNDNDPRLDTDFNDLSDQDRRLFRVRYREIAPERRNERGTIVYLLGKNLRTDEDWAFLREVVGEPPCLSLVDCAKTPTGPAGMGDEVTLAYPALVALRQAQRAAAPQSRGVIAAAKSSRVRAVARLADGLERRSPH